MILRVMVARSPSSDWKLWTGIPSSVRLVAAFALAVCERFALATMDVRAASALTLSWSSNRNGLERPAHMPFDVIGEHAQEHVGAHAIGMTMMNGSHL